MLRRKVSFWGAIVGVGLCAVIGLEPILPGPGGCAHVWIFDCEAVQSSAASALLGIPNWIWGGLWFITVGALTLWSDRRKSDSPSWVHLLGFGIAVAGWWDVVYLRGIELWVVGAACLECWLVAVAAFVAGYACIADSLSRVSRKLRGLGYTVLVLGFAGAFMVPFSQEVEEEPLVLPDLPGWTWVRVDDAPFTVADFQIGDPDQFTLVFVYDPHCEDCGKFVQGPLQDEMWQEMMADFNRVAVLYDELVTSPHIAEAPRTPALILFDTDGEVITSESGMLGEDELFAIIEAGFRP